MLNNEEFSVQSKSNKVAIISRVHDKLKDNKFYEAIVDTLLALLGVDGPNHLYAHLITHAKNAVVDNLNMIEVYSSLPVCTETQYGGDVLLKY